MTITERLKNSFQLVYPCTGNGLSRKTEIYSNMEELEHGVKTLRDIYLKPQGRISKDRLREDVEFLINSATENDLTNDQAIEVLEKMIEHIQAGFVGEPA